MRLIRNLILAAAASLGLAGCITTAADTGNLLINGYDVTALAQQVRDGVKTACFFDAQAAQIVSLVNNGVINSVQEGIETVCRGVDGLKASLATKRMASRPGALHSFTIKKGGATIVVTGTFIR